MKELKKIYIEIAIMWLIFALFIIGAAVHSFIHKIYNYGVAFSVIALLSLVMSFVMFKQKNDC